MKDLLAKFENKHPEIVFEGKDAATNAKITDQAIFGDTSRVIRRALERTRQPGDARTGLTRKSFEMTLRELV